jgi:uncharacterized glyoxalase superfamily protein PhnB
MTSPTLQTLIPISPAGTDVDATIAFYEKSLGFSTLFRHGSPTQMAVIKRGHVEIMLTLNADKHLADNTAFRIKTTGVEDLYKELSSNSPSPIHPNGKLEKKPWGSTEFAIIDPVGVCITFYEFPQA